jgi:hypothetical protein
VALNHYSYYQAGDD